MKRQTVPPSSPEVVPPPRPTETALPARYEPPRVVTHSARALEETSLPVNACTSYIP